MFDPPLTNDRMIARQLRARDIHDQRVLDAMRRVDRALFVPPEQADEAYADSALPIDHGQTISQPYIVGLMTQLLAPLPHHRILEIGTGTGYQTAVLAELAAHVFTLEIIPELSAAARARLQRLGYGNVTFAVGDGWRGLPDLAPFDGILVAAAPETMPPDLPGQLVTGGRLVVPVGVERQELMLLTRTGDGYRQHDAGSVRFVPLVHAPPPRA